jgi:PleD family two-component response regulator
MPPLCGKARILCADSSEERLGRIRERLAEEGFDVVCIRSAAECLSLTSEWHPAIVVLDAGFLRVDSENIPEYIGRISPTTHVFLAVDDPGGWSHKPPQHVHTIVKRGDPDAIVSRIRRLN